MKALIVIECGRRREVLTPRVSFDDRAVMLLRDVLREATAGGGCAAVTVVVHPQDETCDHDIEP